MRNYRKNTFRVVAILLMLSTAPLTVTYSYADSGERRNLERTEKDLKLVDNPQKERLQTFFTKDLDEKFELSEFDFQKDNIDDNMNRILFRGTYADYKGYQTGIVLFDGKSSKDGAKYWTISVNGSLNLVKGELNLEVIGKSNNSKTDMTENLPKKDLDYRIIFSGNMTESDEKNQFIIAFLNSTLENSEKSPNLQILPIKSPAPESINSIDSGPKVRNPDLVF
ncbi:MAG: hypothetical protein ACE5DL_00775 [Nitrosopumilaceae archaeon]